MTFNLLIFLSTLIMLTGMVAVVLGAFRASVWWGLAVFFVPLTSLASLAFGGIGTSQGMIVLLAGLALGAAVWLSFFAFRWKEARQGVLVLLIGSVLSAAGWWLYAPPEMQAQAWMTYQAMRTRLPWLPQVEDPAPAAAVAGAPAASPRIEQVPWPAASSAAAPVAGGPALAVNAAAEAEARRTLDRLNVEAQKLRARSEKLAGSRDNEALRLLRKDIDEYNAQRIAAIKRASELKVPIADQPAATPAPAPLGHPSPEKVGWRPTSSGAGSPVRRSTSARKSGGCLGRLGSKKAKGCGGEITRVPAVF